MPKDPLRRNIYPTLRLDDCIGYICEVAIFYILDGNSVFWEVEIENEDEGKDKSALKSHHGLYRFAHMQFGLMSAPGTFQKTMDVILANVKWRFISIYFDDIVIF